MNPSNPTAGELQMVEMGELSSAPRKIPSLSSLLHILWLRKWPTLAIWLILAVPVGLILSIFNLPKSYNAATVLRFPEVVGAQTNVMRDVAITRGQSIISIFNSYQVMEASIRKLGLRMRITTPHLFQRNVFKEVRFGENLGIGFYTVFLEKGAEAATVLYKPRAGASEYKVFSGPVRKDYRLSMSGLDLEFQSEFAGNSKGVEIVLELKPMEETIESLKESMAARPLGGGNYEIRLKDRDPWMVAEILNTLREQFLEVYYGTTEVQDVGILVQMEKDLELSKERLEKSQDELSKYYTLNPELVQQQAPSQGDNMAYLDSRQQIENLQQRKKRVQEAMAAKEVGATPEKNFFWASELLLAMADAGEPRANILRASLQELNIRQAAHQRTLGPEHPKIREVEAEKESIYRQIEEAETSLIRKLDQELSDSRARMASNTPRRTARPAVRVQLELERLNNVNVNNQTIYDRLLESYNRAKLVTGSEFFKVSVVDPARPDIYEPPSLKTRLLIAGVAVILLLVVVFGAFLAWSLVIIKIWTKDDIRKLLALKALGVIALRKTGPVRGKGKGNEADQDAEKAGEVDRLLLFHGSGYQLEDVECFRIIREEIENLFRNAASQGRFCLMVTSSRPHEGKSTCAANLAVTFARKGKRTLLVDADFRLGRVAKIFNLKVATGLDDILDQPDISAAQFLETATLAFQTTLQRNLVIAPRRSPNPNAGELVSSDRFKSFIRLAREQFDVVVIDTPPVMITPEPLSLAELVDGVVFVCRSGVSVASEARDAIEILKERKVRVAAILNGVRTSPFEQNRYKKYSYYYQVQPKPGEQGG